MKTVSTREKLLLKLELALVAAPVSFLFLGAAAFFLLLGTGISPHDSSSGGGMLMVFYGIALGGAAVYSLWFFPINFIKDRRPPLMPWLLGLILAHLLSIGILVVSSSLGWRTVVFVAVVLFLIHIDSLLIRTIRRKGKNEGHVQ